ncbi:hypothetical protein [Streptomyces sp. NBC_00893]|uniref:hypothetical protein n=1 Tax=Streptomyces sp. NBC_00893 TaxID=2975862 RepID=UPI0022577D79|nr:hypothetical protein [Streptomyces sp. NBC_00893]MCX4851183.1 hypothetical protein [Streptomyces sp. NBC_00893]
MRDARTRIADALTDSGRGERETALLVLGHAVRWAADTLGGTGTPHAAGDAEDTDGADALTALYALDDALADTHDLADALPALLRAARAGERLGRDIQDLMAELTSLAGRIAVERAALDEFLAREAELRQRLAEHERLRHEVDELRRLEALVAELDDVRAQRAAIDGRLQELRGEDPDSADQELRTAADSLLRLTEQQLSVLAPRTRQSLQQVAEAQRELEDTRRRMDDSTQELSSLQETLEGVRAEYSAVFASLTRHAQADRELAHALHEAADDGGEVRAPGLTPAEVAVLTESVERRLAEADRALRRALVDRSAPDADGRRKITSSPA